MAPPNWWGTPTESSISWSEDDLGGEVAEADDGVLGSDSLCVWPARARSARGGPVAGIAAAPVGRPAGRSGSGHETERSMRASPGSWRAATGGTRLQRTGHPAGGFDEMPGLGPLVTGGASGSPFRHPGGGGPHRLGVERAARSPTGSVQDLVAEVARSWPGNGPAGPWGCGPTPGSRSGPWDGRPRTPYPLSIPTRSATRSSGARQALPQVRSTLASRRRTPASPRAQPLVGQRRRTGSRATRAPDPVRARRRSRGSRSRC